MKKPLTVASTKLHNNAIVIPKRKGKTMKRVLFELTLPATMKKKAEYWLSSCPVLDLFAQGKTETEALKNLEHTVRLFLTSCYERGTLDQALKECGFTLAATGPTAHRRETAPFIKVPLHLLAPGKCQSECHA